MRKRILGTTKLLAVTLVAMPACTHEDTKPAPEPAIVTTLATATATTATPVASSAAPVVAQPGVEDPKLLQLRDEMFGLPRDKVMADTARFRPLCDKDGYPLVGNLMRKVPEQGPQPSELCAEIRKKK